MVMEEALIMFNKCPFCGKDNVIVNSLCGKYYKKPPHFCIDCGYTWYQEDMESSNIEPDDLTEFEYGLACQVED